MDRYAAHGNLATAQCPEHAIAEQTRELEAALVSEWQPLCNVLLR